MAAARFSLSNTTAGLVVLSLDFRMPTANKVGNDSTTWITSSWQQKGADAQIQRITTPLRRRVIMHANTKSPDIPSVTRLSIRRLHSPEARVLTLWIVNRLL